MEGKDVDAALTDQQDRSAFSAKRSGSTGNSTSPGASFLVRSKIVKSLRNMCFYVTEEECGVMGNLEVIVKGEHCVSFWHTFR